MSAGARDSTTTTVYVPPSTGCTAPGDTAPNSLLQSLAKPSVSVGGLSLSKAPKYVDYVAFPFLGSAGLLVIMILVGIVLLVVHVARKRPPLQPGQKRSHTTRNAWLAVFLILIIVSGSALYVIYPYLVANNPTQPGQGELDNFITPSYSIQLAPGGVINNSAQTYPNGQVTLLAGNFTVNGGGEAQFVILPNSELNAWTNELRAGNFTGQAQCPMMGNLTVLYNSGAVTSGSFFVQIPAVSHDTLYDLAIADPSNQEINVTANVYYGFQ